MMFIFFSISSTHCLFTPGALSTITPSFNKPTITYSVVAVKQCNEHLRLQILSLCGGIGEGGREICDDDSNNDIGDCGGNCGDDGGCGEGDGDGVYVQVI
jgi:hypothetical protein